MKHAQNAPTKVAILSGVSGCGKTYLGACLKHAAEEIGLPVEFFDADDFHPVLYKRKARKGTPMNDDYRRLWISMIVMELNEVVREGSFVVLACSALKRWSRDKLRAIAEGSVQIFWLNVDEGVLKERLARRDREGWHFYGSSLLPSQFRDMEVPGKREPKVVTLQAAMEQNAQNIERALTTLGWNRR